MDRPEPWAPRLRTLRAAGLLCLARLLVALVPLRWWRRRVGPGQGRKNVADPAEARRLAAHIERAAWRLPFTVKCLPQAIALSWQLRRRAIDHQVVLALRPPEQRQGDDTLHAWIEAGDRIVLGDLPGPWARLTGALDG